MNGEDYLLRRKVKALKEDAHKESIEMRAELLLQLSKISRLEGRVDGLIDHIKDQDKKIEKLQLSVLVSYNRATEL